nr:MAG TPA: hypothetical protein [Caudoviricetes sp.]
MPLLSQGTHFTHSASKPPFICWAFAESATPPNMKTDKIFFILKFFC